MRARGFKRCQDGTSRVCSECLVWDVKDSPAFFSQISVSTHITLTTSDGQVLPPVAFQSNAEVVQGEVNRVPSDLELESVIDLKFDQNSLGQALDIGSVAGAPFFSNPTRLEAIAHSEQGGAARGTASLAVLDSVARQRFLLSAVGAHDVCSPGSMLASSRTVADDADSGVIDAKDSATVLTSQGRPRRGFALHRAVGELVGFAHHHIKWLGTLGARLRNSISCASQRAEATSVALTFNERCSTGFAGKRLGLGLVTIPRTEPRKRCSVRRALEWLAAPLTREVEQCSNAGFRALWPSHLDMHYSSRAALR